MAKQITAWQTHDGLTFNNKEDALKHEAMQELRTLSGDLGEVDIKALVKNPRKVVRILKPLAEAMPQAEEAR